MKTKYAVLVLVTAYGFAVNSFADEQRPLENQTLTIKVKVHGGTNPELTIDSNSQTVKIKAHGETIAELKVADNKGAISIRGGAQILVANKLRLIRVNDGLISVQINCSGGFPITLQADEVELNPDEAMPDETTICAERQPAMLFARAEFAQ